MTTSTPNWESGRGSFPQRSDVQADAERIILSSGRLRVEVARPGTVYRRSRFDWSGMVTQVYLDGRHTFCAPESLDHSQGTGGIGLCNEFGMNAPVGYDDAKPGEAFPKLGVGLIVRPDLSRYSFLRSYPVQPFPINIEHDGRSVEFVVEPVNVRGYAARLRKKLTVTDNQLEFDYLLENTGQQRIHTTEYAHNFLAINLEPIGPAYALDIQGMLPDRLREPVMAAGDSRLTWNGGPPDHFAGELCLHPRTTPFVWKLTHLPTGANVSETLDVACLALRFWGVRHVVSPEVFIGIDIPPGGAMKWRRIYTFSC